MIVGLVPAYNEERSIGRVIKELSPFVDRIVVCDDGSRDRTSAIAHAEGADVVRHRTNMGYGAALASLFTQALRMNAQVAVTIDADGQHDPRSVPSMASMILRGNADLVVGSRFLAIRSNIPLLRKIAIEAITKLTGLILQYSPTDSQCGMRAYGAKALALTYPRMRNMGASLEILMRARRAGLRIKEVPTLVRYDVGEPLFPTALVQLMSLFTTILRLRLGRIDATPVTPPAELFLSSVELRQVS